MRILAVTTAVLGMVLAAAAPAGEPSPLETIPAPAPKVRDCSPEPQPPEPPGPDPMGQALRHYVRGRLLMSEQQVLPAVEALRQAAILQPDVHAIWLSLGLSKYDSGDVTGAVEAFDRALRLEPSDAATLYFRARIAGSRGDLHTAASLLARLLEAAKKGSPFHILGTYHMAMTRQNQADIDGAIAAYEALLDQLAEPQSFFQRYPELFLVYRSQLKLSQTLAGLLLQQGRSEKAITVLRGALAARPESNELLSLMCTAYLQKKDFPAAREWAKRTIESLPEGATGYQRLAEAYKAEGNADGVIPELERYRREHPGNRMLAWQLASAYEAGGRKKDALPLFRELSAEAEKTPGTGVAAALRSAEILIQENKPVDALQELGAAMVSKLGESAVLVRAARLIDSLTDPQQVYRDAQRLVTDAQTKYGPFVLVGMLAEVARQPADAMALYDKAIAREAGAAIAYSRKADLLIGEGRHEDALAVYRAALKAKLDLAVFHRKIGLILEQLDRPDEAIAEYRLARRGAPDDKATSYLLASALARKGAFDEARQELEAVLARAPNEAQAHCQLAGVYLVQGNLEAAEQSLAKAQALDPKADGPKALLTEVRYRQKRYADAEKMAREFLAEHSEDQDVRLLMAYAMAGQKRHKEAIAEVRSLVAAAPENLSWRYLLSGLYTEMGDAASAERELQHILRAKPDHAPSNNDLGYLWADRGVNLDRAEAMVRQALKVDPQSAAYLDSLGWVLYKRGRFEDAVRTLEEATRLAPELDPVLWDHLGDSYWQLRRRDDAVKAWQNAAKICEAHIADARPDDVQRIRQKLEKSQAGAAPPVAPPAPGPPGDTKPSP